MQAGKSNEAMKVAAARALAALAHEDVPDSVLNAYGLTALKFGRDYVIPKPLDPRVMLWVSPAVAQACPPTSWPERTSCLAGRGARAVANRSGRVLRRHGRAGRRERGRREACP